MTKRPQKKSRHQDDYEVESDLEATDDDAVTSLPPVREKKKRPIFFLTVLIALALLIALAPSIISLTPLGPNLVASAAKEQIAGTLEVKGVSIGWISPIRLSGIAVKDAAGQPLGVVKTITINKSLLGLLSDSLNLNTITIDEPKLQLVMRPDGSNLEDLLAPMMKRPASNGDMPQFTLDVRNASVELVDAAERKTWQFTPISVQIASPKTNSRFWDVHAEGKLQNAGLFADIKHSVDPTAITPTLIDFRSEQFPLESLRSLLARAIGETQIAGMLSGKVLCEIDANAQPQHLQFENVEAINFAFASKQLLGADGLQIQQCKANGSAQLAGGVWQLKNLQVESDVAAIAGTGDVRISDFTAGNALPQTDCNVRGVIDLARLTKMLPNVLKVREGVEITSGRAHVSLVSHAAGDGRRFEASMNTENLQARNNGQLVELKEPVAMGAVVTQTNQGWRIDRLDAKSSFLTADVTGTTENGQLTLRGDLQRLKDELAQFFDLSHMKLAGAVDGELKWEASPNHQLATQGSLRFARLAIEMPGMLPWIEDDLQINFNGAGIQPNGNTYRVGTGDIEVVSAKDRLTVKLRQAVESISIDSPLPADIQLAGNLATWLPRLQAFVPLAGWQVSGLIDLQAQANISSGRVELPVAKFKIQQFKADGNGLHIHEPVVQGETQFTWDNATGAAKIANTTIQSTTVAIASEKLEVQTGANAKMTGEAALRGDLGKVLAWFNDPAIPVQNQCFGELEAEVKFTQEGSVSRANLAGHVTKLAVAKRMAQPGGNRLVREVSTAPQWQTVWTEPDVSFGGEASYDAARDTITLNKMQTKAGTSLITSTGTISQLTSTCVADLTGELRYDLAALAPLARPYLGDTFNIVGVAAKPFELRGPLLATLVDAKSNNAAMFPSSLTGKAGLNWESAEWMALQMGGGELSAELKNSTIFVQPTKIPLSQGTVNLSPVLVLGGPNWYVSQSKTQLIDHVVITPEMCNTWIKFVAPLVAEATQAQGQFSVDLEQANVPVNRPTACDMKGIFTVHNVVVGPGPLAQQVIGVAQQVKSFMDGKTGVDALSNFAGGFLGVPAANPPAAPATAEPPAKQWLELPEQNVPVEVVDGRVHHQGLSMHVKDVVIRTSGSVGIADQSLSLVAEIPILDDWIKNRRELSGLKGQSIQIPIGGSVSKPQLDTRGLLAFSKNLAVAAGRGAVESELSKTFEKGTGAVQNEVGKVQSKITEQMSNGKAKLENELRDGLKNIFGS